jgi:hypothetical protein
MKRGEASSCALQRRSAAARASSVIVAPASILAISRQRFHLKKEDPRCDAVALIGGILGDAEMACRAGRDLRRMGHGEHLHASREPRKPLAYGIGHRTAGPRIDFIKHKCRSRALLGKNHFQGQHETGKLAAGGDFHQGAGFDPGLVCTQNST